MKKTGFILLFLLCLVCLTGCYKQEKFDFQEGRYAYTGEEVTFYEDIDINSVYLDLELLTDMNKSVIMNRKSHKNYNVEFTIVTSSDTNYICELNTIGKWGKVGDQVDRYYVIVDVSEILEKDNAKLELVLEFENPGYYKDKSLTDAIEISIQVKRFTINENYVDSNSYDFPNKLYYVK